jgi:hypothetical protein
MLSRLSHQHEMDRKLVGFYRRVLVQWGPWAFRALIL